MSALEGEDFNRNFTDPMPGSSVQSTNKPAYSNNFSEISSLEKVRDILFGSQMREMEKKFTRIEERLVKECTNLRDETKKRLDYLENYIKNEVEALTE